jgi:hypothetical protein
MLSPRKRLRNFSYFFSPTDHFAKVVCRKIATFSTEAAWWKLLCHVYQYRYIYEESDVETKD